MDVHAVLQESLASQPNGHFAWRLCYQIDDEIDHGESSL